MKKSYKVLYEEVILHKFEIDPCEEGDIVEEFHKKKDGGEFDFSDGELVSGQLVRAYDENGKMIPLAKSHADLERYFFQQK